MGTPELYADTLVYMFGHLFATEWVERKVDPVFSRVPPDARARVAPIAGTVLSEKSLAEQITYACLAQLAFLGCVDASIHHERGWNFEHYDRVYFVPKTAFPSSPIMAAFEKVVEQRRRAILLAVRRRFLERGVPADHLVAGLRRYRYIRADPYQFVCTSVERHLVGLGFYRTERRRVAGPFLAPVMVADAEAMSQYEFLVLRLQRDLERFELEDPILADTLRSNVLRSMLKTRSDEEYITQRTKEEEAELEALDDGLSSLGEGSADGEASRSDD